MLVKPCCPMDMSRPLVCFHFSTTITIMSLQWALLEHCWWASGCEMIVTCQRPKRNKSHHSVRAAPSPAQSLEKTLFCQCTPQDIPWFNAASNSLAISWSLGLFHALMELYFFFAIESIGQREGAVSAPPSARTPEFHRKYLQTISYGLYFPIFILNSFCSWEYFINSKCVQ